MLSGDLVCGNRVLRAGDYQTSVAGSLHPEQTSIEGCTAFVRSSLENEFLTGAGAT